jgi:hypothetical protein
MALGAIAASELWAAGWRPSLALAAWALLAAKAAGAILYVRARLRSDRGGEFSQRAVLATHAVAAALAALLAAAGPAPWSAVIAFGLLLGRAAYGLSPSHRRVRAQLVGMIEVGWGFVFILSLALGYSGR